MRPSRPLVLILISSLPCAAPLALAGPADGGDRQARQAPSEVRVVLVGGETASVAERLRRLGYLE